MSGSQEKKRRSEERAAGIDRKADQLREEETKKKKGRTRTAIIASAVAVVLILVFLINSTVFYTKVNAMEIDGVGFSAADYNYYYNSTFFQVYDEMYNMYGNYVTSFVNPNMPLKTQYYDEEADITWADYIEEQTTLSLKNVVALNKAFDAEGMTLTDEYQQEIQDTVADLKSSYAEYGYGSFEQYLTGVYGKGMNEEIFVKNLTMQYKAQQYGDKLYDEMSFTEQEYIDRYQESRDEYDSITFRMYFVSGNGEEENAMEIAKETADKIATATSESEFADLVYEAAPDDEKENYEDEDATLYSDFAPSSIASTYSEWLLDDARQNGDTGVVEAPAGYFVLYFIDRSDNSYNLRTVRHILFQVDTDEEGNADEDSKAEALNLAETVEKTWQENGATEEVFAQLAEQYSEDSGSNENGGLYENIRLGQMVQEFEDWTFDESRKAGDVGIVYVESDNYSGYHLIYFVGEGMPYNEYIGKNLLEQESYNAWLEEATADYDVSKTFAFRFARNR